MAAKSKTLAVERRVHQRTLDAFLKRPTTRLDLARVPFAA
jgi:hypothetical protein